MDDPVMQRFLLTADDIFADAKVKKEGNEEVHRQVAEIMANCMATISVGLGMSKKRFDVYKKQYKTLVKDLKGMKRSGEVK